MDVKKNLVSNYHGKKKLKFISRKSLNND